MLPRINEPTPTSSSPASVRRTHYKEPPAKQASSRQVSGQTGALNTQFPAIN